ncbi:DUF4439 domain-containing protein [Arthrobacter sp. Sa2BUA2]|uniref:DUF4439 domain-containing protein n=1 Tax=Arthrobacter pullicola TaxID=2762224 RepID=A0ABR8YFE8_9MICC|nr:DUF4439 domain-containing protein [Arthrobacter pullicola]MBD8042934.1 DUF4439 domain-containing protein [Arthrobacter pullicola]
MNTPPSSPTSPATRPSRTAAAAGTLRRALALGVLACVIASFGLTLGTRAEADRPRTFSEKALNEAFATVRILAAEADALAAAGTGASAGELRLQAQTLKDQALLLTSPGGAAAHEAALQSPGGGEGSYPVAVETAARANLEAAGRADYGTARLLASVGTAQLLLAERAGEVLGVPVEAAGESQWTPVLDEDAAARCTTGGDASARTELRDRPGAAEALQTALDAEYGAVYAYEVAQAQSSGRETVLGEALLERRAAHLEAGRGGVGLLPALCLPEVSPVPAYSLSAEFLASPARSLAGMEAAFPGVYADLVGSSDGAVRSWAIDRLVESSRLLYTGEDTVPASPGLDAEPAALPWADG